MQVDLPKFEAPKVDLPKFSAPKMDMPKFDAPKVDMPKFDASKFQSPKFNLPAATNKALAPAKKAGVEAEEGTCPTSLTH